MSGVPPPPGGGGGAAAGAAGAANAGGAGEEMAELIRRLMEATAGMLPPPPPDAAVGAHAAPGAGAGAAAGVHHANAAAAAGAAAAGPAAPPPPPPMDLGQAAQMLELSAGDVELAAGLFLDDYMARHAGVGGGHGSVNAGGAAAGGGGAAAGGGGAMDGGIDMNRGGGAAGAPLQQQQQHAQAQEQQQQQQLQPPRPRPPPARPPPPPAAAAAAAAAPLGSHRPYFLDSDDHDDDDDDLAAYIRAREGATAAAAAASGGAAGRGGGGTIGAGGGGGNNIAGAGGGGAAAGRSAGAGADVRALQRFLRRQQQGQGQEQEQEQQGQEQQRRRNNNNNNNNNHNHQQNQPQQQNQQRRLDDDEDESALIHRLAREADALVAARRDRMRRQRAGAAAAVRGVDAADAAHRERRLHHSSHSHNDNNNDNDNNNNEGQGEGGGGNGVPAAAAGAAPVRGDSEDEEDIFMEPRGGGEGGGPRRVDAGAGAGGGGGGAGDDANANAVPADDEAEDNNNNNNNGNRNRLGNRGADGAAAAGARAAAAAADLVSDGGDDEDEDQHHGHSNDASDMDVDVDVDDASSTGGGNNTTTNNNRSSLSGKKRRRRARSRDGGGDGDDPSSSSSSDDDDDGNEDDSISSADHRGNKDRREYDRRYDRDAAGEDGYRSSFSNSSDDDLYLYPTDSDADQSDSDSEDDLLDEYRYYTANTDRTDDDDDDDDDDMDEEESGLRRLVRPAWDPAPAGRAGREGPDVAAAAAAAAVAGSRERRRQRSRRRQRRRRSDGSGLDDDANDAAPPVNLNDVAGSSPARARRLGGRPTRGPSLLLWGRPVEQIAATGYRMYSSSMAEEGTWEAIRNRIRTERKIRDRDKKNPVIPRTWLSAAFTASSDYSGLALSAPPPDEVAYLRRIQRRANRGSTSFGTKLDSLPPYHCTGATLLLSLVTSMMYSGASIQGKSVNCSRSSRKPFADLTEEERKREFEPRLADALAAILYAAAKNSAKRREAAIQRLERRVKREERGSLKQSNSRKKGRKKSKGDDTDKDDADKEKDMAYLDWQRMRIQQLRRRLRLCPVARWEDIPLTNTPLYPPRPSTLPDGGDSDDDTNNDDRSSGGSLNGGAEVKISVSYTNIADLRQYVEATMKSFCAPGGCALFLETLVRIAGIKRIRRSLSNEKVPSKIMESVSITPALLACTCCDRARGTSSTHKGGHGKKSTEAKDVLPTGHGCLSPHLINILLNGTPTNNLASTTTGELGVGIISMNDGGRNGGSAGCDTFGSSPALLNPSHPIWLVCGELCYSVLRVSEDSLPDPSMRQTLPHGAGVGSDSFVLKHQSPWYGCKHTTEMRIHPVKPVGGDLSPKSSAAEIAGANNVSPGKVAQSARNSISQKEIDAIVIHPQDKSYYPKDYRRWRFDVSSVTDASSSSAAVGEESSNTKSDSKLPAVDGNASVQSVSSKEKHQKWTPFYRLGTRQRLVVEAKLAPKINLVVSKRFPGSSVSFKPGVEPPFV